MTKTSAQTVPLRVRMMRKPPCMCVCVCWGDIVETIRYNPTASYLPKGQTDSSQSSYDLKVFKVFCVFT